MLVVRIQVSAGNGPDDFKDYIYVSWGWVCVACFGLGVAVGTLLS